MVQLLNKFPLICVGNTTDTVVLGAANKALLGIADKAVLGTAEKKVFGKGDKEVFGKDDKAVCSKADKAVLAPWLGSKCVVFPSCVESVDTIFRTGEVSIIFVLKMTLTMALCLSEIAKSNM